MKKNTNSFLTKSKADFSRELNERIAIGNELLSQKITSNEDLNNFKDEISKWSEKNKELIKQSFDNPDNEYLKEYEESSRHFGFLGTHTISDDVENIKKYKLSKF